MPTTYLEIRAVQRPFPIGLDDAQRMQFSINFEALAQAPVERWEEDLVQLLTTAGAASPTDTFVGSRATLSGSGPFTTIIDSGGSSPLESHDGTKHERLSVQMIIRAASYPAARTRALAVWRALDGLREITVV